MTMALQEKDSRQTPTLIVSGFLGSGKTTIIGHLIDELQGNGQQVAYIKNEIGDEALDTKILQGKHIQSKELLNGCICCTLVGPFQSAIAEIVKSYHPDLIIIEASGTADPAAIALMIDSHPLVYRDSLVSIVDVMNFTGYTDISSTARNQTKFTDLLIFNKIESVSDEQKRAVVGYVRELNEHSPIIEAPRGRVSVDLLLGANHGELSRLLTVYKQQAASKETHTHLDEDALTAFSVPMDTEISEGELANAIAQLPRNIIRVKGLIRSEFGERICNAVARQTNFSAAPIELRNEPGFLIVIGVRAAQYQQKITSDLQALGKSS